MLVPIALLQQALKLHVFKGSGGEINQQALRPRLDWANLRLPLDRPNHGLDQPSGVYLSAALHMSCELSFHLL
ncbi:hypothetical protein D9M68_101890 [compost metagenome]